MSKKANVEEVEGVAGIKTIKQLERHFYLRCKNMTKTRKRARELAAKRAKRVKEIQDEHKVMLSGRRVKEDARLTARAGELDHCSWHVGGCRKAFEETEGSSSDSLGAAVDEGSFRVKSTIVLVRERRR